jgi:hypothetical protein
VVVFFVLDVVQEFVMFVVGSHFLYHFPFLPELSLVEAFLTPCFVSLPLLSFSFPQLQTSFSIFFCLLRTVYVLRPFFLISSSVLIFSSSSSLFLNLSYMFFFFP